MKPAELTGAALDWAVAKCEGYVQDDRWMQIFTYQNKCGQGYNWSTNWATGGPIIEREKIDIRFSISLPEKRCEWMAETPTGMNDQSETGQTPLIAAMRCYVASKLGDEVNIPEELT